MDNKIIIIFALVGFIAMLGFADWMEIQYIYEQNWEGNHEAVTNAFWIIAWSTVILVSFIYYTFTKDFKGAMSIAFVTSILILMGLEDISFYIARFLDTGQAIDTQMCWFKFPITSISTFLKETCVTPFSLFANVIFGSIIGLFGYKVINREGF